LQHSFEEKLCAQDGRLEKLFPPSGLLLITLGMAVQKVFKAADAQSQRD